MAVPKQRTTPSKRGMRRMHHKITAKRLMHCKNCNNLKVKHHICASCGFYKGQKLL